jgi:hypothetical protein
MISVHGTPRGTPGQAGQAAGYRGASWIIAFHTPCYMRNMMLTVSPEDSTK